MLRQTRGRWAAFAAIAVGLAAVVLGASSGWVAIIGVVAIATGMAWAIADGVRAARQRDAYATFAAEHGWDYLASSHEYGGRFRAYPFAEGIQRRQESVVRGDFSGVRCASFTHVYEESSNRDGEVRIPVAHQVTLAELPVALPRLDIVPETLGAQVAKRLGGRDVDVESHEFNARWRVIADDARYAHAVLDPRMIERLLSPDAWGAAIRIEGGAVYTWTPGRQGVDALAKSLGLVAGIARRIPPHVLREYRERGHGVTEGISDGAPSWATEPGALTSRRPTDLAAQAGYTPMPVEAGGGPGRGGAAVGGGSGHSADALAAREGQPPLAGPAWATESGALTTGRYTGVGVDADGDGIEDWRQLPRG
ncbi:hypothetical protein [Demequina sp. NBRC 110056]|uniref:hypothetical protein n=1 Tax=Demequina sp. NBRC 110056 TaxID=1570345 RepID=UPI000A035346|nr:hypothetical protein [Demequina sp. NBRC 110056]